MRNLAYSLAVIAASLVMQSAGAQEPQATIPSCPATATLDQLIVAIDAAVSGPANKDRTCFRQLFLPDAKLSPVHKLPDGSFAPRILSVDDWINAVAKRGSETFFEKQIKVKTETYGHFAHLWSTYETRTTPDAKPMDRGINSIQAVFDGQRWRVISILWEPESSAGPVPEKYLP
ncbi:MAG TPA: hypothetical protein VKR52_12555 [Terracidiphilus sp.]|nr:hypothetical protein [Terracidiphilus sp.]